MPEENKVDHAFFLESASRRVTKKTSKNTLPRELTLTIVLLVETHDVSKGD
jgi:hypothetical protein